MLTAPSPPSAPREFSPLLISPSSPDVVDQTEEEEEEEVPIVSAEKALSALLNGVLAYSFCFICGLGVLSLRLLRIVDTGVNWWLLFSPFWLGNLLLLLAHFVSFRHTQTLTKHTEAAHQHQMHSTSRRNNNRDNDRSPTSSNEPLLPLLRRIIVLYSISIPLMVLLLWSELAFCARLVAKDEEWMLFLQKHIMYASHQNNLYVCFAPLLLIEGCCVLRYLLCNSRSILPCISWTCLLTFTSLLAYQTSSITPNITNTEPLSWSVIITPLLVFQLLMFGCLIVILYHEFTGNYALSGGQFLTICFYGVSIVFSVAGEVLFVLHSSASPFKDDPVPSILIFIGLLSCCLAFHMVSRRYIHVIMSSRGGAVPVPLVRTSTGGWAPKGLFKERWLLLGDISLTAEGFERRHVFNRRASQVENELNENGGGLFCGATWSRRFNFLKYCCCFNLCCCTAFPSSNCNYSSSPVTESMAFDEEVDTEAKIGKHLRRRNSGSYSEI